MQYIFFAIIISKFQRKISKVMSVPDVGAPLKLIMTKKEAQRRAYSQGLKNIRTWEPSSQKFFRLESCAENFPENISTFWDHSVYSIGIFLLYLAYILHHAHAKIKNIGTIIMCNWFCYFCTCKRCKSHRKFRAFGHAGSKKDKFFFNPWI